MEILKLQNCFVNTLHSAMPNLFLSLINFQKQTLRNFPFVNGPVRDLWTGKNFITRVLERV